MKSKSIIKKSGLYLIGNMASKILSAIALPVYAFFISAEELGYYDYSQSIMNIIIPFAFLAVWEAILKYILDESKIENQDKLIASSAWFSIIVCTVICIVVFIYAIAFTNEYIWYITVMICTNAIAQIWQYYSRALRLNKVYVVSGIIPSLLSFVLILVFVCLLRIGLKGLYISYIVGQVAIILYVEFKLKILKRMVFSKIDIYALKKMLKFSAPLVLNLISAWFLNSFAQFLIKNKLGTYENGLFAFAGKFSVLVTMLGSVVTMAIIEEAILSYKSNDFSNSFSKIIDNLFKLFQLIIIIAIPIIMTFYNLIKDTEYYNSLPYVPALLFFSVLMTMASNIGSIFHITEKTKYQMVTTAVGGVLTAVISVLFINEFGIHAVIYGQLAGAAVMIILRYMYAKKSMGIRLNWFWIIIRTIIYLVVSYICTKTSLIGNIFIFSLTLIIVSFLNIKEIKLIFNLIKGKIKGVSNADI